MKAWLVTWEGLAVDPDSKDRVVAILSSKWSDNRVAQYVELLYGLLMYTFEEQAAYAKRPAQNPYRSQQTLRSIDCGASPWLHAEVVDDLEVTRDESGAETITWKTLPVYRGRDRELFSPGGAVRALKGVRSLHHSVA